MELIEVLILQGFEALIDSSKEYPLTKIDSVMIRPGHTVSNYDIMITQNHVLKLNPTRMS